MAEKIGQIEKTGKKESKIKIKLIKSIYGNKKDQIGTIKALGLRRINQIKEVNDNPVIRGMIFKVKHMIEFIK